MKRIKIAVVAMVAALSLGAASGVLAQADVDKFQSCINSYINGGFPGTDYYINSSCCKYAGGSWVEVFDSKGNLVGGYCHGVPYSDAPAPSKFETPPSTTPTPNETAVGSNSGTVAEPTTAPAPTRNTATSGSVAR